MRGRIVSGVREAVIFLTVLGGFASDSDAGSSRGQSVEIDAAIDTGFTGHFTLPASLATEVLTLPARGFVEVELADGSATTLNVYEARVLWHGRPRRIPVYETEGAPLVGMSLLRGSRLTMEIMEGGAVEIEELL